MSPDERTRALPAPALEAGGPNVVAKAIRVGYGTRTVIEELSLDLLPGTTTAIIGPNGSGKSTLLRALGRLLALTSGAVYLNGQDIHRTGSRKVARQLSILPQAPRGPGGLTVQELVEQGRFPYGGLIRALSRDDHLAVERAIELTHLGAFVDRTLDELSGGERQRAWLALALAQEAPILLLDEPTTYLDVGHQFELLELIDRLREQRGLTVAMVVHDLQHAASYAHRIVVLNGGQMVADGAPAEVLTPELLATVFRVRARVEIDPETGRALCIPLGTAGRLTDEEMRP